MAVKYKFGISVFSGLLLWVAFVFILGTEPWDSKIGYGIVGLIGLVLGLSWPDKAWLWPIGHYLGQLVYWFIGLLLFSKGNGDRFFIPLALGVVSLTLFCLPVLIMSIAGMGIRKLVRKSSQKC